MSTELPKDINLLVELANGPSSGPMLLLWRDFHDHGIAAGEKRLFVPCFN